jgi:hypothetical protein
MKSTSKSYFISAFVKGRNIKINSEKHYELGKKIDALSLFKTDVVGVFQGNVELSWCVSGNETNEQQILDLLNEYKQICALVVYGSDQTAKLLYPNGFYEKVGTMVNLGPEDGQLKGRDYSFINGQFYVIE